MSYFIILLLITVGLFFSVRAIILRRNAGCGVMGLISIILIISAPFILLYLITAPPPNFHRDLYEEVIGLPYPASAIVITKEGASGLNTDYGYAAVIKVNSADYQKALQKMESENYTRDTTFRGGVDGYRVIRKADFEDNQFNPSFYTGGNHQRIAGFHRDGLIIVVEKFRY